MSPPSCSRCCWWRRPVDVYKRQVLVDALPEKAAAQALDVADALSFPPRPVTVRAGTLADCADADILVVAIGKPRLPRCV